MDGNLWVADEKNSYVLYAKVLKHRVAYQQQVEYRIILVRRKLWEIQEN